MYSAPPTCPVLLQATEKARNQKLSQSNLLKIKALQHLLRKSEVCRSMNRLRARGELAALMPRTRLFVLFRGSERF